MSSLLSWWHAVASGVATAIKDQPGTVSVSRFNRGRSKRGTLTDLDGIQTIHRITYSRGTTRNRPLGTIPTFTPGATSVAAVFVAGNSRTTVSFTFDYTDSNGVRSTVTGSGFV